MSVCHGRLRPHHSRWGRTRSHTAPYADIERHNIAPENPDPRGLSGFTRGRLSVVETDGGFAAFPIDAEEVSIDTA